MRWVIENQIEDENMGCEKEGCKSVTKKSSTSEININDWKGYPPPTEEGFGHGKFCYFISCPDSKFPIRDYSRKEKPEPNYETRTYNYRVACNQCGIKNAQKRGINYIIFYTRYRGKKKNFVDKYLITGLFKISSKKVIDDRVAYHSRNPIYLSVEDSIELDDNIWKKWFDEPIPTNNKGSRNLRYMNKFVKKESKAMKDILDHFKNKKSKNKIHEYIREIENEGCIK